MNPLRVGVVGVGHLGYHHARNYAVLDEAQLVGIVDHDPENAAKAARDFSTRAFPSVKALIDAGVEAVSVVVPTTFHAPITTELLEAGVDVLVEKPISVTTDEARAMVACAESNNRLLQVGHIERFNGAVIALMRDVKNPRFIECHRLSPYPNRSADVSVVLDLMIHDLEIVRALDGTEVVSVDAVGLSVFSESEDIVNARLRFASGCVANITASRVSVERMRKIRIFAENAYVSTDYSAQEVLVYRRKPGKLEPGMNPMEMITIEPLDVNHGEPLKLELASFIECVRDCKTPVVSGRDALVALEMADDVLAFIREH